VDDAATALLMSRFYESLKTMPKVQALRQAQLRQIKEQRTSEFITRRVNQVGEDPASPYGQDSVRTGSSLISHPYFWAAFILVKRGKINSGGL
jgi:CHAT domain-containing protein